MERAKLWVSLKSQWQGCGCSLEQQRRVEQLGAEIKINILEEYRAGERDENLCGQRVTLGRTLTTV